MLSKLSQKIENCTEYFYSLANVNGIEAIALYTQNQAESGVVLMDLMMPEMSGLTAMRTLRKISPSVNLPESRKYERS
ncbi:MAG: hypothetical protein QNJ55_21890 [Xenococcus sp. MO_188.B8]|nr:hypothetical protein [Xenococcus sp. MO_188.B8]